MNVCVYKWASIDTHAHTRVWKHMRWGIWVFFLDTIFIVMLVYFFLGCVATHAFFYGTYFENYGLGLGLALFRLRTQMGPAMKKNFDLSRKFFRIFRENLGFETCFKFQFGDNLAWMTIQVSNWIIQWFGSSNPNMLGMIWLGWPPKSQIG